MEYNFSRNGGTAHTGHNFHFQISYKCKSNTIQVRWELADKYVGVEVTGLAGTLLSVATSQVQNLLNKAEYECESKSK